MTNTIRQQIHHPVRSDSNCPVSMSRFHLVKNTRDAPLTDMTLAPSHIHLSQTPSPFVMTHFQFNKRAPLKMNSVLRGRRKADEYRAVCVCVCNLVFGR